MYGCSYRFEKKRIAFGIIYTCENSDHPMTYWGTLGHALVLISVCASENMWLGICQMFTYSFLLGSSS